MKEEIVKIVRYIYNAWHVEDHVYINGKLQFCQPNLNSINKKNCKEFKTKYGKVLKVSSWEWGNTKE